MTIIIAALILALAFVSAGLAVYSGLDKLAKAFGWSDPAKFVPLDEVIAKRFKDEELSFDEDDLILGTDLHLG